MGAQGFESAQEELIETLKVGIERGASHIGMVDHVLLLAEGMSNCEIGNKLSLTEGTVKNYVTNVLQKIGARDRTQAALRGRELGLI